MVQTATEGHFDVVIGSVDKMIAELRQEEQDDIDLRDYCQDEENKVENEIEDLQHKATNIQGLIERLEAKTRRSRQTSSRRRRTLRRRRTQWLRRSR